DSKNEAAQQKQAQEADRLKQGNGTSAMASDQLEKQHQEERTQPPSRTRLADAPSPAQAPRAGTGNANESAGRAIAPRGAGAMPREADPNTHSQRVDPEPLARPSNASKAAAGHPQQTQEAGQGSGTATA